MDVNGLMIETSRPRSQAGWRRPTHLENISLNVQNLRLLDNPQVIGAIIVSPSPLARKYLSRANEGAGRSGGDAVPDVAGVGWQCLL